MLGSHTTYILIPRWNDFFIVARVVSVGFSEDILLETGQEKLVDGGGYTTIGYTRIRRCSSSLLALCDCKSISSCSDKLKCADGLYQRFGFHFLEQGEPWR